MFFAFLFSEGIHAQQNTLTLSITDSETKDPLSSVTILIDPCSCGGITNDSGLLTKRLKPDSYTLIIEYLGYKKKQLR